MEKLIKVLLIITFLASACSTETIRFDTLNAYPTSTTFSTQKVTTSALPSVYVEIGDGGLLTGIPCGPPCLLGIEPGKTNETEAYDLLRRYDLAQWCTSYDKETGGGARGIACDDFLGVGFRYKSNIVEEVDITPVINITVEEVINKFGPPSYISVDLMGLPDQLPIRIGMVIGYNDFYCLLNLPEEEGTVYKVEASTRIVTVGYFEKSFFDKHFSMSTQIWKGFGEYSY